MRGRHYLINAAIAAIFLNCAAFGQTYTIQTIAGGALPNNIPGKSASIGQVAGLAVDSNGNVFLTSLSYHAVFRLDFTTQLLTVVAGTGTPGFSGDNGLAVNAQLDHPLGVAVDPSGRDIYIADTGNARVRKISNGVITTIAGTGKAGMSGDGGAAANAQLRYPNGVALDSRGNLYIADLGNGNIREVSGGTIASMNARIGLLGPMAVAVDESDNLFYDDLNDVYEMSNGVVTTIMAGASGEIVSGGCPAFATPALLTDLRYTSTSGLAADRFGNVYVAGLRGNCVARIARGTVVPVAGSGPAFGPVAEGGLATGAFLNTPLGLAVDRVGHLYIADSGAARVRLVWGPPIATAAGGGSYGENGPAGAAQLNSPEGLAFDAGGNLYFADTGDSRVGVIVNGSVTTVAGNGTYGISPDGSAANVAELGKPTGVAVDPTGNVYIADTLSAAVREASNGVLSTLAGNLTFPVSTAADNRGNVFVTESAHGSVTEYTYGSAVRTTGSTMRAPQGMGIDAAGNVYIADTGQNEIVEFRGEFLTGIAGGAFAAFFGDGGPAQGAGLSGPQAVAADGAGNIYIADTGNNRIRKVSGGLITTIAGNGTAGFSGDGGAALSAELNGPGGILVDAAGNVYFSDSGNNRIRKLTPARLPCTYGVSPNTVTVPPNGGSFSIAVETAAGCSWAVGALPELLVYQGSRIVEGSATITMTAGANRSFARSYPISVAGTLVTLSQGVTSDAVPVIPSQGIAPAYSHNFSIQPGSWISIFGQNLAQTTAIWKGDFPQTLGGVSVTVNGRPGYLSYVSPRQINLEAPDDTVTGTVQVVVTTPAGVAVGLVDLAPYSPSLSLFDSTHAAGVIVAPDGTYDLLGPVGAFSFATRPARPGETIELYGVGFGPTNPMVAAGAAFSGNAPLVNQPTVTIGGMAATVGYAGITSAGLYQFNIVVPNTVEAGDYPVVVSLTGAVSPGAPNSATAMVSVGQ